MRDDDTGLLTRRPVLPLVREGNVVGIGCVGQTFHRSDPWAEPGELRGIRDLYKNSRVWVEDRRFRDDA